MAQAKITLDDVRRVARLSALALNDEEQNRMCRELDAILGFMSELDAVDVSQVPPTFYASAAVAPLRADEVRASWPREELLQAAPATESGAFAVPKVLEGDK